MKNEETKVILSLLAQVLRQVSERALAADEMAWRTYAALVRQHPDFLKEYQSDKGISFERIQRINLEIAGTLDQIAKRLQD